MYTTARNMRGGAFAKLLALLFFGVGGMVVFAPEVLEEIVAEFTSDSGSYSSDYASTAAGRPDVSQYQNSNATPYAGPAPERRYNPVSSQDRAQAAELKREVDYAYNQFIESQRRYGSVTPQDCRWDNRRSDACHWYIRYKEARDELERLRQGGGY